MAWEYRDTDCSKTACPYQPRCTVKSENDGCKYYERKQKGFLSYLFKYLIRKE